ncbi:MAG: hypothetical protein QOH06_5967 [Acidobacteriota bacterium]|jgi:hypothetical protein|nr:hypothetical protein [Acidobacteriota bacterium]
MNYSAVCMERAEGDTGAGGCPRREKVGQMNRERTPDSFEELRSCSFN